MIVLEQQLGNISKVSLELTDASQSELLKSKLDKGTLGETGINVRAFLSNGESHPETPLLGARGRKGKSRDDLAIPKSKLRLPKEDTYKFKSDDPNLLSGILDDLRGELEDCDQFGPTGHSKFKPVEGGDANIIDGPHDYAYNKLKSPYVSTNAHSPHTPYMTQQAAQGYFPQYASKLSPSASHQKVAIPYNPCADDAFNSRFAGPQNMPGYSRPHEREAFSHGAADGKTWSSFSGSSFLSVGGRPPHPHMAGSQGYMPYPMHMGLSYMHPSMMVSAFAQQQNEQFDMPWGKANDCDLTTSSGNDTDRKKTAAQNKIKSLIEQKCSCVVNVRGLESSNITNEVIASLFSNFGNISKVLFLRKKHTALVEYNEVDSASVAKEMLNNLTFYGEQLKVCYSTYASVDDNLAASNNPDKFKEVYTPASKSYRFKDYKKISINPPSKVLHLSNVAREIYTQKALGDIFAEEGQVKKVRLLNSTDSEKCMALVELASLEDALGCISILHNRVFFSRNLKISFTRSKV